MGPIEALRFALEKEIEAINLYQRFSIDFQEGNEIFLFLMNEEEKHKKLIEKKIEELTRY